MACKMLGASTEVISRPPLDPHTHVNGAWYGHLKE